jgi:hypothetical protein
MTILEELKSDLKNIRIEILKDLDDLSNVNDQSYYSHLGEERVLLKYINKMLENVESVN